MLTTAQICLIRNGSSSIYLDANKAYSRFVQFLLKVPKSPKAWRALAVRLEVTGHKYSAGVCRDMYFECLRNSSY